MQYIQISQLKLPCGSSPALLETKIRKAAGLGRGTPISWTILRHSLDARKKPQLYDVYSVALTSVSPDRFRHDLQTGQQRSGPQVRVVDVPQYQVPESPARVLRHRPVVVGAGPAGLFAALVLARCGACPVVVERGKPVEERVRDVEAFWESSVLNVSSNVQFGEGGAGTFSDGKLNSNVSDASGRTGFVLRTFVEAGAPEDILYEAHPHIGTDRLREVVVHIRDEIIRLGGEFRYGTVMCGLRTEDGRITGIVTEDSSGRGVIEADDVILAPGHSARDTFRMLFDSSIPMTQKNFAVGMRVSHPQSIINMYQYGTDDPQALSRMHLGAANYKVTARAGSGRGVYSFCMCPGGYIVNASSAPGALAVNGMSDYARASSRANSAIVVTVGKEEFGSDHPLAGMYFQEALEEKAWCLGGGLIPMEWYRDFADGFSGGAETAVPESVPVSPSSLCLRGGYVEAPLHTLLPADITRDFIEGMNHFQKIIPGFTGDEAFVAGLESRTSSPVRLTRGEDYQSSLKGLYPCGEGAGYAGGIMSAAVDGIRTAEALMGLKPGSTETRI